ncbi:MAG: hypothetical protein OSJ74_01040 [Clostridia bacterium]|nr:hypothetical protein [Clostridia bacterium]
MENIIANKKNLVAVIALLTISIFAVLTLLCCNKQNNVSTNFNQIDNSNSIPIDSNYDNINNDINPHLSKSSPNVYLDYDKSQVVEHIKEIISSKYYKVDFKSVSESESIYFEARNMSQEFYNHWFNYKFGDDITGTCSLIAIAIAKNIIQINEDLSITYPDETWFFDNCFWTFKDLYTISTIFTDNTYHPDKAGTNTNTIAFIMYYYYAQYERYLDVSDYTFNKDIRESLFSKDDVYVPFVLSIKNFRVGDEYITTGHSVACVGAFKFKAEYKSYSSFLDINGKDRTEEYTVYLICDGWHNSNDGSFGNNYQFLVYPNNSNYARIYGFGDWINYEK